MRPQDRGWSRALDKQMDFHKWCSSDAGRVYNFAYFTDILEKVTVDLVEEERNIQTTAIQLQGEVIETLWRADTLFVTSDMLHVLMQAAHDLPDDAQFDEEVLITPCGFCLFEEPITGQDRQGLNICVHGMMWKTVLGHSRMEETMEKMLVIYFLVDPNDTTDEYNEDFTPTMRKLGLGVPPLTLQHFYPARFGGTVGKDWETVRGARIIGDCLRVFISMQLLAQQTIGEPMRMNPDRATRKRAAKWDGQDRVITLITLRRKSVKQDDHEPAKVEWSRRWVVKGHWHKYWYKSLGVHKYRYLHEYIKGPEDKPLVVTERRVFNFRR